MTYFVMCKKAKTESLCIKYEQRQKEVEAVYDGET